MGKRPTAKDMAKMRKRLVRDLESRQVPRWGSSTLSPDERARTDLTAASIKLGGMVDWESLEDAPVSPSPDYYISPELRMMRDQQARVSDPDLVEYSSGLVETEYIPPESFYSRTEALNG